MNLRKDHYQKHCLLRVKSQFTTHFTTCAPFTLVNAIQARAPGHALRWLRGFFGNYAVADCGRACQNNPNTIRNILSTFLNRLFITHSRLFLILSEKVWCMFPCETSARNENTTFSNGCLGSHNDEERSEMRYVMRIAEFRESSNL